MADLFRQLREAYLELTEVDLKLVGGISEQSRLDTSLVADGGQSLELGQRLVENQRPV
jgi:hypothetical protein